MKNNTDSILLVEQLSLCDIMMKNCKEKVKFNVERIQYLEAENEYLKKLNALVQEEELVKNKESE